MVPGEQRDAATRVVQNGSGTALATSAEDGGAKDAGSPDDDATRQQLDGHCPSGLAPDGQTHDGYARPDGQSRDGQRLDAAGQPGRDAREPDVSNPAVGALRRSRLSVAADWAVACIRRCGSGMRASGVNSPPLMLSPR